MKVLAESDIYRNGLILEEVHHLMQIFVSKQECLVHGDLHTGSIMVNNGTAKVGLTATLELLISFIYLNVFFSADF